MKARLPKGYGGSGGGDMNAMIRQAQKMQTAMEEKQAELNEREFSTTAGGGVIEVTMTGDKTLKSIKIKPDIVDPDDVEMLEDLVLAAINEAYRNVSEVTDAEISEITGGLNVPGIV